MKAPTGRLRRKLLWLAAAATGLYVGTTLLLLFVRPRSMIAKTCDAAHWKERRVTLLANSGSEFVSSADQTSGIECDVSRALMKLEKPSDLKRFVRCSRIMYNRVPKCGSRTVLATMKTLSRSLNYTVTSRQRPTNGRSHFSDFRTMDCFVGEIAQLQQPFIFSQHLNYVDFKKYGVAPPVYINVIRDPIERLISHYYYSQYGSNSAPLATPRPEYSLEECVKLGENSCMKIYQIIPYFCGHEKPCRIMSTYSLQKAKRNVRERYLVVGLKEDLPAFMEVLEALLPQFFTNASDVFSASEKSLHQWYGTVNKKQVSPDTRDILRRHLWLEYKFYDYVKERFYTLLGKVRALRKRREKLDWDNTELWEARRGYS